VRSASETLGGANDGRRLDLDLDLDLDFDLGHDLDVDLDPLDRLRTWSGRPKGQISVIRVVRM